jgi:hypothetical protein
MMLSLNQPMPAIHLLLCNSFVTLPSSKCSRRKDALENVSAQVHARSSPFGEKEVVPASLQSVFTSVAFNVLIESR